MNRSLMERRCQLCKHYEQSAFMDYSGVCRVHHDDDLPVHRDSWCGRWAEKDCSAVKRQLTTEAKEASE